MKTMNDVVEWLISSGALTALFVFAWKYCKPLLESKKAHAKTEQAKATWDYLETVADTVVTSLVNKPMLGKDKFSAAVISVAEKAEAKEFQVTDDDIKKLVQAAYEKSDLTNSGDPVLQAIKKAPNRANKIEAKG